MSLLDSKPAPASSRRGPWLVVVGLGALVAGLAVWYALGRRPRPVEPTPATAPVQPAAPRAAGDRTGSLEVETSPSGARVTIDGRDAGMTPLRVDALPGGSHSVRIAKEGHAPLDLDEHVVPGRTTRVSVTLAEPPPELVVTSDVPGASVFVDREFLGRTPLRTRAVHRGPHELNVSAEGLAPWARRIDLGPGTVTVEARLRELPPLDASVEVTHRHSFGSCRGRLLASPDGLRYETDHKDAFSMPLARVESLDVDYLNKTMRLQVREGRRYDFKGEPDALLTFQKAVASRLP